MCRFVLYMGAPITLDHLITRPEHSIIRQSFKSRLREEPLNGDGFGVAWYVPQIAAQPAAYRSIRPAWNDHNLLDLARVTCSNVILAHVRAATTGIGVSEANCHPFTSGPLAFMHNGAIGGFRDLKRRLQQRLSDPSFLGISGTTDSEHFFALFQDRYGESSCVDPTERLAEAFQSALAELLDMLRQTQPAKSTSLNAVVTDGHSALASRFTTGTSDGPSLFVDQSRHYVADNGGGESPERPSTVVVASEPLSEDSHWQVVPRNHFLLIDPQLKVRFQEISAA